MAWIYLIIAALFETAWTYSVKFFKFSNLKLLRWNNFYLPGDGLPLLFPLLGYILFGIGNIYFFSMAIKQLPAATAYAVWTAFSLIFLKLSEMFFFSKPLSWPEAFFILLIMTGIMGLKFFPGSNAAV